MASGTSVETTTRNERNWEPLGGGGEDDDDEQRDDGANYESKGKSLLFSDDNDSEQEEKAQGQSETHARRSPGRRERAEVERERKDTKLVKDTKREVYRRENVAQRRRSYRKNDRASDYRARERIRESRGEWRVREFEGGESESDGKSVGG